MSDVVLGYVRVSSLKQEAGFGLEVQEDAIRRYCSEAKLPAPVISTETETGTNDQRVVLAALFERARQARAAGDNPHLVLYRMDRLSRILIHIERLIVEAQEIGLRLHSCSPGESAYLDPDLADDPTVKLIRRILAALVEFDRDVIQSRLDSGLQKVNDRGGYTGGGVPFGYRVVDRDLAIDESKVPAVVDIVRLRDAGWTLDQIAAEMHNRHPGLLTWGKQAVRRVLEHRRLYTEGLYQGRLGGEVMRPELIIVKDAAPCSTVDP